MPFTSIASSSGRRITLRVPGRGFGQWKLPRSSRLAQTQRPLPSQTRALSRVDLESGALLAVTLQSAVEGDTKTVHETLAQCGESICEVAAEANNETVGERLNPEGPAELVLDKGYHSNDTLVSIKRSGVRTYCSEPKRGRRNWKGKAEGGCAAPVVSKNWNSGSRSLTKSPLGSEKRRDGLPLSHFRKRPRQIDDD
jgi:hypothetical protein